MKRSTQINKETFRKTVRPIKLAPIALAVGAVLMLSGCERSDENVNLYLNADECSAANPNQSQQCQQSYQQALVAAEQTAPKYATKEDCVAEFGENQCVQPASAGPVAEQQQGGSIWMPLMAGYMMGRMMGGGYAQQPLFTSKAATSPMNGKFVDASGKNFGAATTGRSIKVPPNAMAPKAATTSTVTRGGFGQAVKQNSMMQQRKPMNSRPSAPRMRSFGG